MLLKICEEVRWVPKIGMWASAAAVFNSAGIGKLVEITKHGVWGVHIRVIYSVIWSCVKSFEKEISVIPKSWIRIAG